MNSLVGYGTSSESEDEEETPGGSVRNHENEPEEKKSRNFLLECGSGESAESCSESERDEKQEEERECPVNVPSSSKHPLPPPVSCGANKLPSPALGGFCVPTGSSVFANPFKEQAEQKLNALQKHVPLTDQAWPTHISGKRVCVAYRKHGRCRFGIRCRFAHDSDLQQNITEPAVSDSNNAVTHTPACSHLALERDTQHEEETRGRRKKHRVGVSDSLIPPKRALKQYTRTNVSHTHT